MTLIEVLQKGMRQLAENQSEGKGIDQHWEAVLPETDDIMANEIFLALYAEVVVQSMRNRAVQIANNLPIRDVRGMNDAVLYLHVLVRGTWLGIADNREFQFHVSNNIIPSVTPNQKAIGYAKFGGLWLPVSKQNFAKIIGALAERFGQYLFARRCYGELMKRHRGKKVSKYVWALLHTDSEVLTEENRAEAYEWLTKYSSKATSRLTGISASDAMHNWLTRLLARPTHVQILKLRATWLGIQQGGINMWHKEQRHQRVSLENDDLIAANTAESPDNPDATSDNLRRNLAAHQKEIEAILNCNPKIAKRQFQVLLTLARDPKPTDTEIAKQLKLSKQTIGRYRRVIEENRQKIRNIIAS